MRLGKLVTGECFLMADYPEHIFRKVTPTEMVQRELNVRVTAEAVDLHGRHSVWELDDSEHVTLVPEGEVL